MRGQFRFVDNSGSPTADPPYEGSELWVKGVKDQNYLDLLTHTALQAEQDQIPIPDLFDEVLPPHPSLINVHICGRTRYGFLCLPASWSKAITMF
jgi:hypothetical protein